MHTLRDVFLLSILVLIGLFTNYSGNFNKCFSFPNPDIHSKYLQCTEQRNNPDVTSTTSVDFDYICFLNIYTREGDDSIEDWNFTFDMLNAKFLDSVNPHFLLVNAKVAVIDTDYVIRWRICLQRSSSVSLFCI